MAHSEKETLFQMILNHPDLQQYLHPEAEGRVPVRVKGNSELGVELSVEKFGKPVQFVGSAASVETTPILEVVLFNINNNQVSFEILYDIEGVTIKGILKRDATHWYFKEFMIFES